MREAEPDLKLAGFSLFVTGWAFPNETDPWSRDTLCYSALIETPASSVRFDGLMSAHAIEHFRNELSLAHSSLSGQAELLIDEETTFSAIVKMASQGHAEIKLAVVTDFGMERHEFVFETDQTFLAESLRQLRSLVAHYPAISTANEQAPKVTPAPATGNLSRILDVIFGKRSAA